MTTARESDRRSALEALEEIVDRGGDADDVLRDALEVLGRLYPCATLAFVEEAELVAGPSVGAADGTAEVTAPIVFQGMKVGELTVACAEDERPFLDRLASLLAPYCLVGWDTGGEAWEP